MEHESTRRTTPNPVDIQPVYCSSWIGSGMLPGMMLPPDLAQLRWLKELHIDLSNIQLQAGVPAEWGYAGAFPRLTWCVLAVSEEAR